MGKAVDDRTKTREGSRFGKPERDFVALGIAISAIILFVGTAGSLMPKIVRAWMGTGGPPDLVLTNAVLLNIALLIFGWRRYNDLHREVTERREAEERARLLAEIDPLTSCLNRRSGTPAIEKLHASATAARRDIAVFMIDIDNFKQVNDLNGHQMGDRVLTTIAARIAALLPKDGVLARIGGDEFVCAFAFDPAEIDLVSDFARQVIAEVSTRIEANRLVVQPTVSVGIATSGLPGGRTGGAMAEELIHRADIAMYHAKKNGRNRFCRFETQMEDELRFRNELETAIRRGIPAGEFVPFYEQQVEPETGELVGFEMLPRWKSPRYGLVGPEVFIAIAEEIGLVSQLSEGVVRQALTDAADWDARLVLSLRLSPTQVRGQWFALKLVQLLGETGFPPHRLRVAITESCMDDNMGAVRMTVASLAALGVGVHLEEFGPGLSQRNSPPVDMPVPDRRDAFVAGGVPIDRDTPENAEATRTRLSRLHLLVDSARAAVSKTVADPVFENRRAG